MKSIAAQSAAAIRSELKLAFPNIKFTVRSDIYTGGSSVTIDYTDAVKSDRVKAIVAKYQIGTFESIDDSYSYNNFNAEIPQVKFVFVNRLCSKETKLEIAFEFGIPETEIEMYNAAWREYNSHFIHTIFHQREFGEYSAPVTTEMVKQDLISDNLDVSGLVEIVVIPASEEAEIIDILFTSPGDAIEQFVESVKPYFPGWQKIEHRFPLPERMTDDCPIIYPNEVNFDFVYSKYPGGQILRVTEVLTPSGEWDSITKYFQEKEIEFWSVSEAIQRLVDMMDGRAFTLEIEDEHGRVKNPDFTTEELILQNRSN